MYEPRLIVSQRRTFKRPVDGVRAIVKTVGFLAYIVDVWDRTGYRFSEGQNDCEPRAAAAETIAMYDGLLGHRVGRLSEIDFPLEEQPAR